MLQQSVYSVRVHRLYNVSRGTENRDLKWRSLTLRHSHLCLKVSGPHVPACKVEPCQIRARHSETPVVPPSPNSKAFGVIVVWCSAGTS